MNLDHFSIIELLTLNALVEQEAKQQAMIYQREYKEEAARVFNRPRNYFYNFPYRKWCRVSRALVRKQNLAKA